MVRMVAIMARCRRREVVISSLPGMVGWTRVRVRDTRSAENRESRKVEGAYTL